MDQDFQFGRRYFQQRRGHRGNQRGFGRGGHQDRFGNFQHEGGPETYYGSDSNDFNGKRRHGRTRGHSKTRGGHRRDDEEHRSGSRERERPPPGLTGRDIGMWYARRSRGKKENEQKANRPTVSMDKDKETNLRHLLNNLKEDPGSGRQGASSSYSSSDRSCWNDSQQAEFKRPMDVGVTRGTSSIKKDSVVKQEPCESWEDLCSSECSSDSEHNQSSDSMQEDRTIPVSSSGALTTYVLKDDTSEQGDHQESVSGAGSSSCAASLLSAATEPKTEDFTNDDFDEADNLLPSVTEVMKYMSAHSDYPYQAGVVTDFEPLRINQGNPTLDKKMQEKMDSLQNIPSFRKMIEFRQKLPSFNMKKTIIDTINSSQVVVISGETGCGKTTQVPQFILDDYIEQGIGSQCSVICTQPRRISAISVAERVAAERCEKVDATGHNSIGYQIRLETKRPRTQGSILFCTTGIVLKFLEGDPKLERATHVIIDEIHERDLQSDFLMIILKDLLKKRQDLKVILMSATLNAEMFSRYFNNCPMLNIPGYTFPVEEYCLEDILELTHFTCDSGGDRRPRRRHRKKPEEVEMEEMYQVWCRNQVGKYSHRVVQMLQDFDYSCINLDLVLHIIQHITSHMSDGAILVFVPGWEEIKKLNDMIKTSMRAHSDVLRVIPLHSLMPTVNQREVFDRPPPGVRKIVIATNIAETSITIDDVVFVIDCGKIKVKDFQPEMNLTSLEAQWVSKANAKQRRGRAGRVQAGHCFHLYTGFHHQMAQDYLPPEMLRTRLEELCLQIKLLKLGRIVPFISKAMQHPSMEAVQHAIETLMELSALDSNENLLPLGYHLARMPVEPHTAKMILFAAMFGCLDHILTVAASLSFKDAFVIPLGKEDMADQARKRLAEDTKSDHIMLMNAFKGWERSLASGRSQNYCWENFLSSNTLNLLKDMKRQLAELLYDIGFIESKNPKDPKANINNDNQSMIRAILCAGLYPNVAQITRVPRGKFARRQGVGMILKDHSKVAAHPKSVNVAQSFFESKWVVFYTKLKTSKIYIHDSTMVSPFPLLFFGGNIGINIENGQEVVSVDDWMIFKASASTANLVKELRGQLDGVLTEKITRPGPTSWNPKSKEGAIMTAIADLITTEEMGCGDKNDGSIGTPDL